MYDIKVGRFDDDPQAQGVIRPADDSWQLVVDKDGYPHLYVRVQVGKGPDGIGDDEAAMGLLLVEDLLPDDCKVKDLMQGVFGGQLSPEEEAEAHREYLADRERSGIPCPR